MLTISEVASYAGVTVRSVRHYHQIGLLPEPGRDESGYRRYGAGAVVTLIKIRTLAAAGVPLAEIRTMLDADEASFAVAVERIDRGLATEIQRLETSRKHIAELAAGDGLALPAEVVAYLDRLRELGISEKVVDGERDGWILLAARWPVQITDWIPMKIAQLDDPRILGLYRLLSEIFEDDMAGDDPRLEEVADIMVAFAEEAEAAGENDLGDAGRDDASFDLIDALALESDPRSERLFALMRERGWARWSRFDRVAEGPTRTGRPPSPR